jgi:hypothetical protein
MPSKKKASFAKVIACFKNPGGKGRHHCSNATNQKMMRKNYYNNGSSLNFLRLYFDFVLIENRGFVLKVEIIFWCVLINSDLIVAR